MLNYNAFKFFSTNLFSFRILCMWQGIKGKTASLLLQAYLNLSLEAGLLIQQIVVHLIWYYFKCGETCWFYLHWYAEISLFLSCLYRILFSIKSWLLHYILYGFLFCIMFYTLMEWYWITFILTKVENHIPKLGFLIKNMLQHLFYSFCFMWSTCGLFFGQESAFYCNLPSYGKDG